jgi:hypothetical protein
MRIADLLPLASRRATFSTASAGTVADAMSGSRSAARSAELHAQSAGTINVATPPGAARAACTARAASPATELAFLDRRTQVETGRARPMISAVSGASWRT